MQGLLPPALPPSPLPSSPSLLPFPVAVSRDDGTRGWRFASFISQLWLQNHRIEMYVLLMWAQSTPCCVTMKGEGPPWGGRARALTATASPPSFRGPWPAHRLPAQVPVARAGPDSAVGCVCWGRSASPAPPFNPIHVKGRARVLRLCLSSLLCGPQHGGGSWDSVSEPPLQPDRTNPGWRWSTTTACCGLWPTPSPLTA